MGAVSALASAFPEGVAAAYANREGEAAALADLRRFVESFPRHAALKRVVARTRRRRSARTSVPRCGSSGRGASLDELEGMARAGSSSPARAPSGPRSPTTWRSRGARRVVLADAARSHRGRPARRWAACGSSSRPRRRSGSRRRASGSSRSSAPPLFEQVGYLFLATTEDGLEELERGPRRSVRSAFPVEDVDPAFVRGFATDDVLGAVVCREDGIADPAGVTRELVRRAAELGVEVRERHGRARARGRRPRRRVRRGSPARRGRARSDLPDPAARPPARRRRPGRRPPADLPMVIEGETGFHFRRVGVDALRLAMTGARAAVGGARGGRPRARGGLARAPRRPLPAGGRRSARPGVGGPLRHDARRAPHHRPGRPTASTSRAASPGTASCRRRPSGEAVAEELLGREPASTSRRTGSSASRPAPSSPRPSCSES